MTYDQIMGLFLALSVFQIGFLIRVADMVDRFRAEIKELKAERRKIPTAEMLAYEEISTEIPEVRESSIPSPFVEGLGNVWQSQ